MQSYSAPRLTEYGDVAEVWFDGANPKPGTGQRYDYDAWYDLIRKLAPEAVIAIKGPDVRWVGNEAGNSRGAEWSVVPLPGPVGAGRSQRHERLSAHASRQRPPAVVRRR